MKKFLMLLGMTSLFSANMFAQQNTEIVEEITVVEVLNKYKVLTNSFWDNWFLSLGGGASVLYGNDDSAGDFAKRISPTLNVSLGKWFTPGLGVRLQYSGLQARGFTYDALADYVIGAPLGDGYYKQRFDYMNLHGDVMFNLNALFGGYNKNRVYEIIPYLGAGFTHNYTKPHRQAMTLNAGIINRFRLSNAVDINLEISAMGVENKFDGQLGGGKRDYDGMLSATIGLTYRFPTRGFARPKPQLISPEELGILQARLAELAMANEQLSNALTDIENQPVEENVETVEIVLANIVPRTIFFEIGSAEVSPREVMNISYLAQQMKQYPDSKYMINGYADSSTGSSTFNQELSLKRAQAVFDVLVHEFGIEANRLQIDANGGVDKFGKPILNRVVLIESNE